MLRHLFIEQTIETIDIIIEEIEDRTDRTDFNQIVSNFAELREEILELEEED